MKNILWLVMNNPKKSFYQKLSVLSHKFGKMSNLPTKLLSKINKCLQRYIRKYFYSININPQLLNKKDVWKKTLRIRKVTKQTKKVMIILYIVFVNSHLKES